MTVANSMAITEKDLLANLNEAHGYLESARAQIENRRTGRSGTHVVNATIADKVSILSIVNDANVEDPLYTDVQLHVLRAIRRGFQLGLHLAMLYRQRSGAASFEAAHGLTTIQTTELNEKLQTAGAIMLFVAARYIVWDTRSLTENNSFVGNIPAEFSEVDMATPSTAVMNMAYRLGQHLKTEVNGSDERLVAAVVAFARAVEEAILNRVSGLKHTDVFTSVTYALESSDFSVSGFQQIDFATWRSVAVKRVERDDIIGNREALNPLCDAIEKCCLYDVTEQMNPILALSKFPSVMGLDGDPGNGKTYLLSAGATYFTDIATELGLPHKVFVVPTFVSKMQGESELAARRWLADFFDPTCVKFGIGDEYEQVVPDHGDDDSSEGQKGVATAFLKAFDGVETVARGDSVFAWATNYIELIDKAWLSRTNGRAYVGGAETLDDYVRFIVLNLRKVHKNFPDLIDYKGVDWNMDLRAPQVPDKDSVHVDPSAPVEELRRVAQTMHAENDILYLARFFWLVKRRFKAFSLRDCKNAIEAVTAKVAGFTLPRELFANPAAYAALPFAEKQGVVAELARSHVASLQTSFSGMLNDRASFFAHEALRVADVQHRRAVENRKRAILADRDALAELGMTR